MLIFVKSMVAGERVPPDSCTKRSEPKEALRGSRSLLLNILKFMEVFVQTFGSMLGNKVYAEASNGNYVKW